MIVPFLDLRSPYLELQEELDAAYARVMESGWYVLGEKKCVRVPGQKIVEKGCSRLLSADDDEVW